MDTRISILENVLQDMKNVSIDYYNWTTGELNIEDLVDAMIDEYGLTDDEIDALTRRANDLWDIYASFNINEG